MMTRSRIVSVLSAFVLSGLFTMNAAQAAEPVNANQDIPIEAQSQADMFKVDRDQPPIQRNYVQQPPLIPHTVKGYKITKNFNKCLDCHSWNRVQETGATKVGISHFKDRDGKELNSISPRRYFCMQCHVPQYNAKPLVNNTFKPVDSMNR